MKTLLQIDICRNSGSTGKISEDIGKLAIQRGWNSYKAYSYVLDDRRESDNILIPVGDKAGYYLSIIETRLFDNHCLGLSNKRGTEELIKTIEEIKPDIIQLHDIKGYFLNIRILFEYLAKRDIPIVWTVHSCWQFTGHCGHFDYLGCERWKTGCYKCPGKKQYPTSWLLDRSKKNWEEKRELFTGVSNITLVPVSNWLSNLIGESFLKDLPRQVIYNGIDTNVFKPMENYGNLVEQYGLHNKIVLLAAATAWGEKKGFNDYLKLREYLSDDYIIVLIGLKPELTASLPRGIVGISKTNDQEELAKWYSLADVVLNLSYEETFGLTTVEGFGCGTPSVVYNKTASPELISKGVGYVVDAGNIQAVADAVNHLIKDNSKDYYRDNCRKYALAKFDKENNFNKYIELYDTLLEKRK